MTHNHTDQKKRGIAPCKAATCSPGILTKPHFPVRSATRPSSARAKSDVQTQRYFELIEQIEARRVEVLMKDQAV